MKIKSSILVILFLLAMTLLSKTIETPQAAAQNTPQTSTLVEDFANGRNPPILNAAHFNHQFSLGTAWDLTGSTIGEPLSQSPPYALTLYAGNEDRVTFNQPSNIAYISSAQVWGWTLPAQNDLPAGRGRVVFEGTGDSKTFTFNGGTIQWQLFKVMATELGDNGRILGEITAVRLADIGNNGNHVMFDDLEVVSVTPPRRSNLSVTMTASANNVQVNDLVFYDVTIHNAGPHDAPNVVLSNRLPIGGSFVTGSSANACQLTLGQVSCNLGTLATNSSRTIRIALQVGSSACASFVHQVTATAQALDNNLADNTAVHTATTPFPACADLAVTLNSTSVPLDVGESLVLLLTIQNHGPDTSSGTAVVNLPSDTLFIRSVISDSGVMCSVNGLVVNCTFDPLVSWQRKEVVITARITDGSTGMQTTTAEVFPLLDDPLLANNQTRFRFPMGPPFEYTIIAELGTGVLAPYDDLESIDINAQGEVSFVPMKQDTNFTEYAVFVGDGQTLTQRFSPTDLPALNNGLVYRWGIGCADLNEQGEIVLVNEIHDPALDDGLSSVTRVGSMLTRLNNDGSYTNIDVQTDTANGIDTRYHEQATFYRGGIAAIFDGRFNATGAGITHFVNGQKTDLYQTAYDVHLRGLNSNGDRLAWQEEEGFLLPIFRLMSAQRTASGLLVQAMPVGNNPIIRLQSNYMIGMNDFGGIAYAVDARDATNGLTFSDLYVGGPNPILKSISVHGYVYKDIVLNNHFRFAYHGGSQGLLGLYFGPDPVAHRIVRYQSGNSDVFFGSRVTSTVVQFCPTAINDAGQVAFAVKLANGRLLVLRGEPTRDNDGDGITDWDELGGPNFGDANEDGIPDSYQPEVASIPDTVNGRIVTIATNPNYTLSNAQAIPNPSPSDAPNASFPFGHFSFELSDLPADGRAEVTFTFPWGGIQSWWKYGPTPTNPTAHWYEFNFDGNTGVELNGNKVTMHLVDGGRGDADLTVNGVIVDPGGPTGFPETLFLPAIQK